MILSSTFHDPQFRLKSLLKSVLPIIKRLFSKSIVCCTPSTVDKVSNFFRETNYDGFEVVKGPNMSQIDNYKKAISVTIDSIESPINEKIFYIDFDRLIHWALSFPDELKNTLKNNEDVEYLHIGRTSRAFETHPLTQRETESIINELASKVLGFPETRDLISVCYLFTEELGEKLIKMKNNTKTGFYSTWPIILWKNATKKRYIEVEGHEWETPDRFLNEITKIGYNEWLKQYQTSLEWQKRVRFLHDAMEEIYQFVGFKFKE